MFYRSNNVITIYEIEVENKFSVDGEKGKRIFFFFFTSFLSAMNFELF